ncbi:MAG: NADH-quinone oxidoreductase subunit I [Deltaproteobacteria bacterium]|nr:NADH-quinone oxidoreductase subunit I [Deltaproteobacteria bacterium]
MTALESSYLTETLKGLSITLRHFLENTLTRKNTVTLNYPEEKKPYPERFRGLHRLMKRDDGQVRCVACMCCATVCPAHCIKIEAGEHDDHRIEKFPIEFSIDWLRCVYCGLCVDACPCDAIRMDTGEHPKPQIDRNGFLTTKIDLMKLGGPSVAVQGGVRPDNGEG